MAVATAPRKFTPGHFAFMRAVVQGIDVRASWDRYLRTEGEHDDLRKVRSTIAWMRTEFAAAARRHARPGTARLILFEADEVPEAPGLPSLAAFAAERGLEDFSEARAAGGVRRGVRSGHRRRTKVAPRSPDPPPARGAALARAAWSRRSRVRTTASRAWFAPAIADAAREGASCAPLRTWSHAHQRRRRRAGGRRSPASAS